MAKVLYDLFPAIVAVLPPHDPTPVEELSSAPATPGAYQVDRCRIIITDERIIIAKDSPEGPVPIFSEGYDYSSGSFVKSQYPGDDSTIITEMDKKLVFKKDDACGCGSRLRSWNPYNVVFSKNDPTE